MDTTCNQRNNELLYYQSPVNQSDAPINTSITFTDRQASQQAATTTDTEMELAQLYAYVSSMPSLAKKRKLLKQFNKAKNVALASSPAASSSKHKRTKSFGDSIKVKEPSVIYFPFIPTNCHLTFFTYMHLPLRY